MNKEKNSFISISLRYSLLILIGIFGLKLLYSFFTFLTIFPLYHLFHLFFEVTLKGNTFFIGLFQIEIINACVAGSAYFFLLILNLSTPNINFPKRTFLIISSFLALLIANILRIFFLSLLLINKSSFFDFSHKLFWYILSTVFVVGIWFIIVKIGNIKEVPFYSDIKFLFNQSNFTLKKSKKKK